MGTTTNFLVPSLLLLALCSLPLFFPSPLLSLSALYTPLQQVQHIYPTPHTSTETTIITLSTSPLVIYIKNFITPLEATELVALSNDNFAPSPLYADDGTEIHNPAYRSSLTATLPLVGIVREVEERARGFDFYYSSGSKNKEGKDEGKRERKIKPLVVQKYGVGKEYRDHYDWFLPHPSLTGNIESTFFVYISANCTGGGTRFPRLHLSSSSHFSPAIPEGIIRGGKEDQWCEIIDCDRPYDEGVTFRPITGNAIFWRNVDEKGDGYHSTLHAGLPVTSGEKMGLNVWTWRDD